MSDLSTFAPRLPAGLAFSGWLLTFSFPSIQRERAWAALGSPVSELRLASRPRGRSSRLRQSIRGAQGSPGPAVPEHVASASPSSLLVAILPFLTKEGPGHCLAGRPAKASLPQGFICLSLFAFQGQSGCNFSSTLQVWLL